MHGKVWSQKEAPEVIEVGQLYVPLQEYGKDLIKDVDMIIEGHHLVVKDFRVVSWDLVEDE